MGIPYDYSKITIKCSHQQTVKETVLTHNSSGGSLDIQQKVDDSKLSCQSATANPSIKNSMSHVLVVCFPM